jgi:ketosteroid isomerase-like protein
VTETLLDELECARLTIAWARHVDRQNIPEAVALFTDDCILHSRTGGADTLGREAIGAFLTSHDANRVTRHVAAPPFIEMRGPDTARGVTAYVLYDGQKDSVPEGQPMPLGLPLAMGEFHQTYRRTPQGWRIVTHRSVGLFRRT